MDTEIPVQESCSRRNTDVESQHVPANSLRPDAPAPTGTPGALNLATIMASNDSLAIFRRFGDLTMLNLLCLQSELTSLRAELLDLMSQQTKTTPGPDRNLFRNTNLVDFSSILQENKLPEREVLEKIRIKLKEYSKC